MKTTSAFAPARSASSIWLKNSVELDVLVLQREVVDAAVGRGDPARHFAGLDHALLQGMDEGLVGFGRDPAGEVLLVLLLRDQVALRVDREAGPGADGAAEAGGGELQAQVEAGALDLAVPAPEADLAVLEVGVAHHFVQRVEDGDVLLAFGHEELERRV